MPRKPKRSILEYYPYPTFRPGHKELLLAIESNWKDLEIILIVAAPGVGKTALRRTIAYWAADSIMTVPTNDLLRQELLEFPNTRKILGRDLYDGNDSAYYRDLDLVSQRGRPILCVPHSVIARRYNRFNKAVYLSRKVFIADEGHRYIQLNQDLQATHLWRRDAQFPPYVSDRPTFEEFLTFSNQTKKVKTIRDKLLTNDYMIKREKALLRGNFEDRIALIPLFPDIHNSLFRSPEKLIFMSATINELDIYDLGISKEKRITKFELPSIIPKENRPLIPLNIVKVSINNMNYAATALANSINELANFHRGQKGLVHATYATAAALRPLLGSDSRYLFHTADSIERKAKFDIWRQSEDKIYIASGYEEGIDLKGDEYEWQAITRIPWPSLGDPAIRKKVEITGQHWYIWQALKPTIQATGRICRGADDYGVTYILDSNWDRLISEADKYNLIPDFFKEIL